MSTTKTPRYWTGKAPTECDICHGEILDAFTDGKTWRGPWGIMCERCVSTASIRRSNPWGEGIGQHYVKQANGKWMKTAG